MLDFTEKYVFKDGNNSVVKEQNVKMAPKNLNSFCFGEENSQSVKYAVDVENKSLVVMNSKKLKENLERLNNESLNPLIEYIANNTDNSNVVQIPVQNIKMDLKLGLTLQMDDSLGLANKLKINATGLQVMPKKSKEYLAVDMYPQNNFFLRNVAVPKKINEYIANRNITFGNSIGIELFNALMNDEKNPVNKINVNYKTYGKYNNKIFADNREDFIKKNNIELMKLGDKIYVPSGASAVAIPISENNIRLLKDNENKYMIEFLPNVKKGMHGNICLAGLTSREVGPIFEFIFNEHRELGKAIVLKNEMLDDTVGYYLAPNKFSKNQTVVNVPNVEKLFEKILPEDILFEKNKVKKDITPDDPKKPLPDPFSRSGHKKMEYDNQNKGDRILNKEKINNKDNDVILEEVSENVKEEKQEEIVNDQHNTSIPENNMKQPKMYEFSINGMDENQGMTKTKRKTFTMKDYIKPNEIKQNVNEGINIGFDEPEPSKLEVLEKQNKDQAEEIESLKQQLEELSSQLQNNENLGIFKGSDDINKIDNQPEKIDANNEANDTKEDVKEEITPAMQNALDEKDNIIKQLQDENEKLSSKSQELEEKEKAIDSAAKKSYISNGALFFGSLAFLVAAVLTANPILFIAGVVFMGTNAAVPSAFYAQTKRKIEKKYKQLREKRQAKVYEQEQNEQNELSNNIELSKQKLEEAKANKKLVEEKYKDELAAVDKFKEERIQKINEENKKLNEKIENLTKENEKLTNENVKLNEQHKIMNQTLQALPEGVRKQVKDTYESIKQNTKTETITDENVIKEAEAIKQETEKINEQNAEFNEQAVQSEKLANEGIEEMIDADNMNVSGKTDLEERFDDIKETVDGLEKGNKEITEQLNSKVNLEKNVTNNNNNDLTM